MLSILTFVNFKQIKWINMTHQAYSFKTPNRSKLSALRHAILYIPLQQKINQNTDWYEVASGIMDDDGRSLYTKKSTKTLTDMKLPGSLYTKKKQQKKHWLIWSYQQRYWRRWSAGQSALPPRPCNEQRLQPSWRPVAGRAPRCWWAPRWRQPLLLAPASVWVQSNYPHLKSLRRILSHLYLEEEYSMKVVIS